MPFPILPPVNDANDQDGILIFDIDNHVGRVAMQSHGRSKSESLSSHLPFKRQQVRGRCQALLISFSLIDPE